MDRPNAPQSCVITCFALALLAGVTGCDARTAEGTEEPAERGQAVRPGIQVLLEDRLELVRGRRVGLITNHTGILRTADGEVVSSIDALHDHPEVELVALYGPEHGMRGTAVGGEAVASGRDPVTGLPIHSLYGDPSSRKPSPETLAGVDVLLFDIQDIGARYYTYVWTMTLAMEAAAENGIPFVVLDRPNPIGGETVQGNVLDPAFATFVGRYPVAMRHGMTPGEMARFVAGEFAGGDAGPDPRGRGGEPASPALAALELTVVPALGWARSMAFADTGLPWVPTSPNIPTLESALHYAGTCLFEGTVLSVGRGTGAPFQLIGHPALDGEQLAERLAAYGLPGVDIEPAVFTPAGPDDGKFDGVVVEGVRLTATGPDYDPTRTAVAILVEARALLGGDWAWTGTVDRLAGTDALRRGVDRGEGLEELTAGWPEALEDFRERRRPYLLYP